MDMQNVLTLTPDEKKIFDALSDALKDGWKTEVETLKSYERPDELLMRYEMASFSNPACKALADAAMTAKSADDIEKIASGFDITKLSESEMAELFFTLGTKWMSGVIRYLLSKAESDSDIEGIAHLSTVRNMLLTSNSEIA